MRYRHLMGVVAIALATNACAAKTGESRPDRRYDRNVLTREELAQRSTENMYNVVSSMRSDWMRRPLSGTAVAGRTAAAPPMIFLDGRRIGEFDMLKSFSAESIEQARYYAATDAQNRFSTPVAIPVIELTSRGRSP